MTAALYVKNLSSAIAGPFELSLAKGTCAAITGPSGSGKSVFLRMIADLDPNDGEIWLNESARAAMPAPAWRRQVMYVPAESGWWADTVVQHFPADQRSELTALAGRLGLRNDILDAPIRELSTGEKQRLSLIRALLLQPPVLLLDEPTGPLDGDSTAAVETILRERMASGTSVVLVTHNPSQADRLGHQRYRMVARRLEKP